MHNPYFQYFAGGTVFRHALLHERSGLPPWRKWIGEKFEGVQAESLRVAHETGALKKDDLARTKVNTMVCPKNATHPTDTRLMLAAFRQLGKLAKENGVPLRQSHVRVAKQAAVILARYAHATQFKRCRCVLRFLRTRLGLLVRELRCKIAGDEALEAAFAATLGRTMQIRR